jgi:hypothetical protein
LANRQIQPVRNRDYAIIRQPRPRGVITQVVTVALQPTYFFRTLPNVADTRQWFWVAGLILILIGLSAVRQESLKSNDTNPALFVPPPVENTAPINPGGNVTGGFPGSIPGGPGSVPPPETAAPPVDITSTWTTALISGSHIILGWFVLTILLCEVSLFNGVSPSLSQNMQIAIWTTVPLGIMAGLQLVYFADGGALRESGLAGLLNYWEGYKQLPTFVQSLLISLTSRLTIFWLWTLVLIYIGARNALRGKRWAVALVVIGWVIILTVAPVLTGVIAAPEQAASPSAEHSTNPLDSLLPGADSSNEPPPGAQPIFGIDVNGSPTPEATVETGS